MHVAYEKGLHELGDGLYAYLQPDGGWGWSNAGLITAGGTSLLVDTLYDHRLTREMLHAMGAVTMRHPINAAMNTHANPDHCFGNELLVSIKHAELPDELKAFIDHAFGPFEFEGITLRPPSQTFSGRLDLEVGSRTVSLIELGPAHTGGDTIVHVPDAETVFTGDLLFIDGTPIVWANMSNWIAACDRILELGAKVLIPGHGPVTDASGVRDVKRYLEYVRAEARKRFDAGMDDEAAIDDIDISDFADWGDPERIAANVGAAYREFDPSLPPLSPPEQLVRMAAWYARH